MHLKESLLQGPTNLNKNICNHIRKRCAKNEPFCQFMEIQVYF